MPSIKELRRSTLCILVGNGRILLAKKKRGFGIGKWNGVGGKQEEGESIEAAAAREAKEEIGVVLKSMRKVAVLNFYFPESPDKDWDQQVHVFIADKWDGDPKETEEMAPMWFGLDEIPFKEMWDDDIHWMPKVLEGKKVEGDFIFGKEQRLSSFKMREVAGF
jgi:8-oxo-dGTP pyrophosphatase MutT (NUDIX family)